MSEEHAFTPTPRPCWIAGAPEQGAHTVTVTHPYDGSEVAEVAVPGGNQVEHAVAAAASAATLPAGGRAEVLERVAAELATRTEEIAETITAESGKPLRLAETEVKHAGRTCRLAAEETRRLDTPASLDPDGDGIELLTRIRRHPRGPVLAITPFSSPLCAVVNDVAAAVAIGAPVLVKPASATPLSALLLGEILAETELPAGAFSILPLAGNEMATLLREPRLPVISFSGSASSAGAVRDTATRKHVLTNLGGGCLAVVCDDWNSESDMDTAAELVARHANYQAGQSPMAVRRVLVHPSLAERFTAKLVDAVTALPTGSPHDPGVAVGPLVDRAAAQRVASWVHEAVALGARLLTGGNADGATLSPAVLAGVPTSLSTPEPCGPVVSISTVDNDALPLLGKEYRAVGLFTHDARFALDAAARLGGTGILLGALPTPHDDPRAPGAHRAAVHALIRDLGTEQVTVFAGLHP